MSLDMFLRLVKTSEEVDCGMDLMLDGDLIDVLGGLQTNVTVLKVRVWNIGSQLEHRCSYSLKFLVFCTVDVGVEFY